MEQIVNAVVKELEGKNPGMDVIKMCLRVALSMSTFKFSEKERIELYDRVAQRLGFDPLEPVLVIKEV